MLFLSPYLSLVAFQITDYWLPPPLLSAAIIMVSIAESLSLPHLSLFFTHLLVESRM